MAALMWHVEAGMPAPAWRVEALLGEPGLLTELCSSSAGRVPAKGTLYRIRPPCGQCAKREDILTWGNHVFYPESST